ncbi:MAG: YbhB/YbcL family Raf kinase inhibitor-like protein [Gammaproteobacteria bacterium]|nr:YbhB/YbcL family Raf kinase inhibitor-like protein [Gammaproteobacteria bacterium]
MRYLTTGLLAIGLLGASAAQALTLTSSAFAPGSPIPKLYTCQGQNTSPPLQWSDIPKNTEAFAIVLRDPDAPNKNWIHWVVYNIPLGTTSLPAAYAAKMDGTLLGKNSWNHDTYDGPCPKAGTHHYRFEIYALDQALYVDNGLTADQLTQAMSSHILGMGALTGSYVMS